tara:strand:- start:641 stop:1426 length:786 start_codon:yes stop_codon:yes gene_type:complete
MLFNVREINKDIAISFIEEHHYTPMLPKLTKHWLGGFVEDELVAVLTLGWGTQPKQTIKKLFPHLDTKDYFEIGKMCLTDEMPKNSETQFLKMVKKWIQENTDIDLLYTMADGIMGKAGYVYQAFNFFYGGKFRTAVYRDTITGEKIHPRTARKLCEENAIFLQKERVHWLTPDYMKTKNLERIDGLMFRYMLPMNKKAKKHFKKSTVDWTLNYPKHKDIEFWKQIELGKYEKMIDWPVFTFDNMKYNKKMSGGRLDEFMT